ncbi:MAG: hypothetical protein KBG83_00145 [Bacteroidetes bacterium]|nr:hypothetical protein [Bacteroidota bacterium]
MNIAQVSNLQGRAAGVLTTILAQEPLLRVADFRPDNSVYFANPDKDTFTSTAARAVNESIQRDAQNPNPAAAALALYGREISVDDVYKQDAVIGNLSARGLLEFLDRRVAGLAVKLGSEIVVDICSGTATSNRMIGFSEFVKDAAAGGQTARLGFTTAELAAMNNQVGLQLNTTTNQDAFIESLIKKVAEVPGANALVMNTNLYARMTTIAKRIGAAGETRDSFGVPVSTFNGISLIPVNTTAITQSESDGTNSDCTSLYIVRFEENLGVTFSTNSGFLYTDFEDVESKPNGVARMQMFLNLTVNKDNAFRRLSRIRL